MAEPAITQINPNMGGQEAAVAATGAAIFTATDRKIIEERGGKIDENRSFIDFLKKRPLTPEVENEETNVKPQFNLKELEERRREHRHIIKHSTVYAPREHVEINRKLPDNYEEEVPVNEEDKNQEVSSSKPQTKDPVSESNPEEQVALKHKKEALKKHVIKPESNPEPKVKQSQMYDELTDEQKKLNTLKVRIRDNHLKRLLTDDENEFKQLSQTILDETLSAVRPEGKGFLESQLNNMTLATIKYKLNFLKSLEEMHLDEHHKKTIKWLEKALHQSEK
jgi:hypothetical protein